MSIIMSQGHVEAVEEFWQEIALGVLFADQGSSAVLDAGWRQASNGTEISPTTTKAHLAQ